VKSVTYEKSAGWLQIRERGNLPLLRLMAWASLRLGRHVGRGLLHLTTVYFVLTSRSMRRASRAYLARALQRRPGWHDLYRHFFCFATTVHDRIFLLNRRHDLFDIDIRGREHILPLIEAGQGVFLMGAHLGSFEVLRAVGRELPGLRVAMVMHEDGVQRINDVLHAINPAARQGVIGLGRLDSMLRLHDSLQAGMLVGMLPDRTLGEEAMTPVKLLGSATTLPVGPFRMAAMLRRPVVFMAGLHLGGNRYQLHFDTLADFSTMAPGQRNAAVQAAIARYAALLEHYCRLAPYNWFNFYDYWNDETPPAAATGGERPPTTEYSQ
jgi:predicted LPLAT superfamily acyltransferase